MYYPSQNIRCGDISITHFIHSYMQHLEDTLNIGLCGHFLVLLATMCVSAFSAVTVQYKNCCYKITHSLYATSNLNFQVDHQHKTFSNPSLFSHVKITAVS